MLPLFAVTMHPFLIGCLLILIGLGICLLSRQVSAEPSTLRTVFWWVGILIAILGLIIVIFPAIAWIYKQLTDMFNV